MAIGIVASLVKKKIAHYMFVQKDLAIRILPLFQHK